VDGLPVGLAWTGLILAVFLHGTFALGAVTAPASEPFRTITDYLWCCVELGAVMSGVICLILFMTGGLAVLSLKRRMPQLARALRSLLIAGGLSLPAMLVWSFAQAISHVPSRTFGVVQGKPDWCFSPLFKTVGSPSLLAAILMLAAALAWHSWRRLRAHELAMARLNCPQCGYDLRLLTTNRCPECGRVFSRQ